MNFNWDKPINLYQLNSKGNDFAPSYYNGNLIFNSDKDSKSIFYISNIDENGYFSEAKLFKSQINNTSINQSYITFTNNNEAYFSKFEQYGRQSFLNIFKSKWINNWTEALLVDSVSFEGFCSHPTVSKDGNFMIFISNKGNIDGNTDLWMSYRNDNDNWGTPFKLDELNSDGNEISPFLLNNDTLFFASDGYEGNGGFDIYISIRSYNKWMRPFPLREFNTEFNESDLIILPDRRAVFASDRTGGQGKLDLYIANPTNIKISKNDKIDTDISIKTQVSNVILQKISKIKKFPSFHFLLKKIFDNPRFSSHYIIDSLIIEYPKNLVDYLRNNPTETLIVDSSSMNKMISLYFESQGIQANRIQFQKSFDNSDFIKCRLLSGGVFPSIDISEDSYHSKPPVIELSVETREKINIKNHKLSLNTKYNIHNYEIPDNIVPFRDILSIEDYADEIFNSDSIVISYELIDFDDNLYKQNRILNISREQVKENYLNNINSKNYEEYYFVLPNRIMFDSDYFSLDYFNHILFAITNSKSIKMYYYDDDIISQAKKIKDLIISKNKMKNLNILIVKENYKENAIFSNDMSHIIVNLVLEN